MAQTTCYPISNGNGTNFNADFGSTAWWSAIDEIKGGPDDSDYGSVTITNAKGTVQKTAIGTSGNMSSVLPITARCKNSSGNIDWNFGITINGMDYSSAVTVSNSYTTYTKYVNISSGQSIEDFDTAEIWVQSGTTNRRTYECSQMFCEPGYLEIAGATTSSSWFDLSFDSEDTLVDYQPFSFVAAQGDTINCTVKDYYHNKPVQGAKIKSMNGTTVVDSALTSSTGWASLGIVNYGSADRFIFEYNQWCFSPLGVIFYSDITGDTTLSATLGPDTIWPNEASAYAFRKPIYFPAIHSSMPKDTDWSHEFESGPRTYIGNNGHHNECIQHSGYHMINWKGKTHVVWRENVGEVWGNTYDWSREAWLGPYELITSRDQSDAIWDSHFYPVITVNPINDYLIIIISGHGTNGITYISNFANDLSNGLSAESNIGGTVTYPRPVFDSYGSRYTEYRDRNLVQSGSYATFHLYYDEPDPDTPD